MSSETPTKKRAEASNGNETTDNDDEDEETVVITTGGREAAVRTSRHDSVVLEVAGQRSVLSVRAARDLAEGLLDEAGPEGPGTDERLVLERALDAVRDRPDDYGGPSENAAAIANLWNAYLENKAGPEGVPTAYRSHLSPEDVGLMMSLLKMARCQSGTMTGEELGDVAGYVEYTAMVSGIDE